MNKTNYIGYRPTWAEINLDNLGHNLKQIKKIVGTETKIMVTVKADAYGHGIIPVSKKLESCGVDFLGVASIDEAIKIKEAGIAAPVLILGLALKEDIEPLFKYGISMTVCDEMFARTLNDRAKALKTPINVHIKVDTGMGRIGVLHKDASCLIKKIHKMKFINIQGLFTHFPSADINKEFTLRQINLFNSLIKGLNKIGIRIPLIHAANSTGAIDYRQSHFNLVRPGLVIYGLYPKKDLQVDLRPVLSLKTKVVFAKRLPKGYGVSYGHDYITKKNTTIATLPIGYGDGYPRNLSNKAAVLIKGRHFKICGRICMDQMLVDVGDCKVRAGDEVVLIGSQGRSKITAEDLAGLSGTIPYEIVCGLGSRIPRVYID